MSGDIYFWLTNTISHHHYCVRFKWSIHFITFDLFSYSLQKKHHILKAVHPSPLSAHRGFLGCKHFSQCNKLLEKDGKTAIDWTRLPQQWADVYTKCMILNWWLYQRANGFRTRIEEFKKMSFQSSEYLCFLGIVTSRHPHSLSKMATCVLNEFVIKFTKPL